MGPRPWRTSRQLRQQQQRRRRPKQLPARHTAESQDVVDAVSPGRAPSRAHAQLKML